MKKINKLNIGIVFAGRFPWNRGVDQLHEILKAIGNDVYIICLKKEDRFRESKKEHKVIYFLKTKSIKERMSALPLPLNPCWYNFLLKVIRQYEIGCFIVRETHILNQALKAAKKAKIPCLVDMRENLPLFYRLRKKRMRDLILYNPNVIEHFEKRNLPNCEHIFTVTEELKEWLITNYELPLKKISVIGNYVGKNYLSDTIRNMGTRRTSYENELKMVFAGNVNEMKGLQYIIRSLSKVNTKYRCSLTVIGGGPYIKELKILAENDGVSDLVVFQPLLAPDELIDELVGFDIGLCPYSLNEFTNLTMPGKLFEYMAAGLPVLSSARKPVKRILKESECGIVYDSEKPEEIASAIEAMIENKNERLAMGKNGRQAVLTYYNWRTSQQVVENALEGIGCLIADGVQRK